jgi:hypothetical protein
MKKAKKLTATFLAFLMVLATLPASALAAASTVTYQVLFETTIDGELEGKASGNTVVVTESDWDENGNWTFDSKLVRYTGSGVETISEGYEWIGSFSASGYAVVRVSDPSYEYGYKEGVINADGKIIVEPTYAGIGTPTDDDYVFTLQNGDHEYGLLDLKTGNPVTLADKVAHDVTSYNDGLMSVYDYDSEDGAWRYYKTDGTIGIQTKYSTAYRFNSGYACTKTVGADVYDHTYDIINTSGDVVGKLDYEKYYDFRNYVSQEGLRFTNSDDGYCYIDLAGNVKISIDDTGAQSVYAGDFINGYAAITKYDDDWNASSELIDANGDVVIPYGTYQSISNVSETGLVWAVASTDGEHSEIAILKVPVSSNTTTATTPTVPTVGGFTDVTADQYYADPVIWALDEGITNGTSDTTFSPNDTCTRGQIITFLWRAAGSPEPNSAASFSDVPSDQYYSKAVAWAAEQGIVSGTTFSPDAPCTRAMAVEFMWKYAGSPDAAASSFTDVGADYAAAVNWAVASGVTNGTSNTTFSPNDTCIRGQIVTFLYRGFAG